ncbi:TPA: hypothetical protein HA244_00965 [Candidatus Micrarchaeota archaeon]|nr:hypothetical protein [Candidatus Micrarchaeota archaeon]
MKVKLGLDRFHKKGEKRAESRKQKGQTGLRLRKQISSSQAFQAHSTAFSTEHPPPRKEKDITNYYKAN